MPKKAKKLVLLDGNALIHRAYHALPPLTDKTGRTVQAVYGFALTLFSVLERFKPEYIAASFDLAGPTFRDEMYEDYKAQRERAPDDLYAQIPLVKDLVKAFNIPIYEKEGYEADDCVGTLTRQAVEKDKEVEVIVVTGDYDTLQLVNGRVNVLALRKGLKDALLYDETEVVKKYGFGPKQLPDFKGLRGDASDNIPGVKGIGEKTASELLKEFGTLENIYKHLKDVKPALREKLERDRKQAELSKKLGTIDLHVPLKLELQDALARDYDREKVADFFKTFGFYSLLKRLPGGKSGDISKPAKKKRATRVAVIDTAETAGAFFAQLRKAEAAVMPYEEKGTLFGSGLVGIAFHTDALAGYVPLNDRTRPALEKYLADGQAPKIFHDAKRAMHAAADERMAVDGIAFDTLLAGYLLNAGTDVGFERLVLESLAEELPEGGDSQAVGARARALSALARDQRGKLEALATEQGDEANIRKVLVEIEMPLLAVLFRMERAGIRLDGAFLEKLSTELAGHLSKIEKKIYGFAGREFNINSPRQLAEILFVDLKIPTDNIKKLKTGYSTASTELAKLQEYPIVSQIESYRELFKLKTTYLDTLPKLVRPDGRIHTTYDQAVAATGRLSSVDPNLQNIPIRSEWGARIREAFQAESGYLLVGADYSQIELRIAAHLSHDKTMTAAFQSGEDIHATTAAAVFGVKQKDVTGDMRRQAKVFNFGILYGMSPFGLSQAAGLSQEDAAKFIKAYLKKFPSVAKFMERMKEEAREKGFVETELGRRRYLPDIRSGNQAVVRAAERMAINMPVQGLAADIMKLAMLACDDLVRERFTDDARMLLQVHDELILEVQEARAEELAQAVKQAMESVYKLNVPLIAETAVGKNWGEI